MALLVIFVVRYPDRVAYRCNFALSVRGQSDGDLRAGDTRGFGPRQSSKPKFERSLSEFGFASQLLG